MSMIYEEEEELFDPSDTDEFLSQVPLSLLEDNIVTQFRDPDNYRQDYVSAFIRSYLFTIKTLDENGDEGDEENGDERDVIESLKENFISFMEDIFQKKLGIGIENLGDLGDSMVFNTILFTYRFFILNIRKNYQNFVFNYIRKHEDELIEKVSRRRDITSQALKKNIKENDAIILANLSDIIDIALSDETVDVDEFFALVLGSSSGGIEGEFISEKFDAFEITGNFVPVYKRLITPSIKVRIEMEIRYSILREYRK